MEQVILYGAGKAGRRAYHFLKARGIERIVYTFCDQNHGLIKKIDECPVKSYEEVKNARIPFIITMGNVDNEREIIKKLSDDGQRFYAGIIDWINHYFEDAVERDRNIIAYYHIDNAYYQNADSENNLNIFWDDTSPFYRMFKQLNLENVIELACGEGRHVQKYIEDAGHITLVDILDNNLSICKNRYKDIDKITYYCNNGYDLMNLENKSYSALFTYDAMVHFEMMDIYSYLKDIHRVLVPGGKALFHHSNNGDDYQNNFFSRKHNRNFMSKEVFAYMSFKCGFDILEQQIIDWGGGKIFGLHFAYTKKSIQFFALDMWGLRKGCLNRWRMK